MRQRSTDSIDLTQNNTAQGCAAPRTPVESQGTIRSYLHETLHNVFLQRRDVCDKTRHGLSSLRNCCNRTPPLRANSTGYRVG